MYHQSVETFDYRATRPRRGFGNGHKSTEGQVLNPDRLKGLQKFQKKLLNFVLLACDQDPFLIYKGIYKHSNQEKYGIYLRPELRVAPSSLDKLREKVRRPLQVVHIYLTIKFLIIFIVQIISCIVAQQYSSSLEDLNRDGLGSNINQTARAAATIERYDSSIRQLNAIGDSVGNPLSVVADVFALLISTLITAILYGFVVMPIKYRDKPLDASNLRFMLDPLREIKRIDLVIEQKLEQISEESLNNRLVVSLFDQIASLRPPTFKQVWYSFLHWWTMLLAMGAMQGLVTNDLVAYPSMYLSAREAKCKTGNFTKEDCTLLNVFTWQELVFFFELFISQFLASFIWGMLMVTIFIDLMCQLWLTISIERELKKCLAVLIDENTRLRRFYDSRNGFKGQQLNPYRCELTHISGLPFQRVKRRYDEIILVLLRTYIKLTVTIDEIRRTARVLKRFTESVLVLVGSLLVTVLFVNYVTDFKLSLIEILLLMLTYGVSNLVFVCSALVFSHMSKQEKIAWSILAELSVYRYYCKKVTHLEPNELMFELVATRWVKLVHNSTLSDVKNSVLPYGISIRYGTVIKLNFSLLSLMSLLKIF